jgi:hypothetical protein
LNSHEMMWEISVQDCLTRRLPAKASASVIS